MKPQIHPTFAALAALMFPLFGCHAHHSSSGTVTFGTQFLHEVEPNDHAANPDSIGGIRVGESFAIEGFVQENGAPWSTDSFDGFAFVIEEPSVIEFAVHAHAPFADLDLWIYDPFNDFYIAQFEGVFDPEVGSVEFPYVGEEFHVIVNSFSGDSSYTLEVIAHPISSYSAVAGEAATALAPEQELERDPEPTKDASRMEAYRQKQDQPRIKTVVVHYDPVHGLIIIPIFQDGNAVEPEASGVTSERSESNTSI